jgi:serine/threonine protein kinase
MLEKIAPHENIVQYLGVHRTQRHLYIMLEYVPCGSLTLIVQKLGSFNEAVIQSYTKQILYGLQHLHNNDIVHRDIKGSNLLVTHDGRVKLADFGASKILEYGTIRNFEEKHTFIGTPMYFAPEVIQNHNYTYASDVWALGCVIIEMITGQTPWWQEIRKNDYNPYLLMKHIATSKQAPSYPKEKISPELNSLLELCFKIEPADRPSCEELLRHRFITDYKPIIVYEQIDIEQQQEENRMNAPLTIEQDTLTLNTPLTVNQSFSSIESL